MRSAIERLTWLIDALARVGTKIIKILYKIRDWVGDILPIRWAVSRYPRLASFAPDVITLSRVIFAFIIMIVCPPITSDWVKWAIFWGGFSDWLDGYIANTCKRQGIHLRGFNMFLQIAHGGAVDPAGDFLAVLFAAIYLARIQLVPATITLLLALTVEVIKIPIALHGYSLVKTSQTEHNAADVVKKERIGEAKMLFLFLGVIFTWCGIHLNHREVLQVAAFVNGISIGLAYFTIRKYANRYLKQYPDLVPRWRSLPRPACTWLMVRIFTFRDLDREVPRK